MARIRTIKPGFWTDEDLSELPEPTHMLAAQLLNYADDAGMFNANPKLIKAEISPLREPSVSIPDSLKMLERIGYLQLGTGFDGKRYGRIVTFLDHQRINRPTPSKISEMEIVWDASPQPHEQLSEPSREEGKGREGNEEEEEVTASPEAPPPEDHPLIDLTPEPETEPDDIDLPEFLDTRPPAKREKGSRLEDHWRPSDEDREFARSLGFNDEQIDGIADRFRDYWIAAPGQKGVKRSWPATWRNWCRSDVERHGPPQSRNPHAGPGKPNSASVVASVGRVRAARENRGPDDKRIRF